MRDFCFTEVTVTAEPCFLLAILGFPPSTLITTEAYRMCTHTNKSRKSNFYEYIYIAIDFSGATVSTETRNKDFDRTRRSATF